MKDINGYVSNIEDDRLNVLIILDELILLEDGDKVKVTFEYQFDTGPMEEFQYEEKEFVGEVVSTDEGSNEIYIEFETEVPKQLAEYDNVEIIKESSQVE